jgi:hypothetical protein
VIKDGVRFKKERGSAEKFLPENNPNPEEREEYLKSISEHQKNSRFGGGEEERPNLFRRAWESKTGKTAIIITGGLVALTALYAGIACIVSASKGVSKNEQVRVLPFNNVSMGVYNKDVDDRLRFLTATVAIELRNMCDSDNPVSWETIQSVLVQCPVLEKDEKELYAVEKFDKDLSEESVNTWLYDFLKAKDADVCDAARIHEKEIKGIIAFVQNSSTHHWMADHVSNSYDLLDIGMIRFPTKTNPYIKLYRLQLSGLFSGSSFMTISHGTSRSLSASVYSCKYNPRDELLRRLAPGMVKNTLVKFEHMLQ